MSVMPSYFNSVYGQIRYQNAMLHKAIFAASEQHLNL